MADYHEPVESLDEAALNIVRALRSLKEEVEAVEWYHQRVVASRDETLRRVLAHNRDEEKEHAAMLLEWIRRQDPAQAKELKDYLFTEGSVTELEEGHS